MSIIYAAEPRLTSRDFRDVLVASTLAARRPVNDEPRLARMLANADLVVTARLDGRLVGVSRAVTDFNYCCYLSDLAVDVAHQGRGVGRELVHQTHAMAGPWTTLVLVSVPAAEGFYRWIGLEPMAGCWGIRRKA